MRSSPPKFFPHKYETVFCIFLIMAAFLYRDNSHLIYPQILYLFLVLLILNLCAGFTLKRWGAKAWVSALFILANCGTITSILSYSGGEESNLWVLFLLPIYTVCMLLNGRDVAWITSGVILFNWSFHEFWLAQWDAETAFYVCLKSGIFIFAAIATWSVANRDHKARERLNKQKILLDDLEKQVNEQAIHVTQLEKMADVGELSSGVAHDLNNPLAVITGTTKVLLEDPSLDFTLKNELERILRSAELCQTMAANMLGLVKKQGLVKKPADINQLVESVLEMYGGVLIQNSIRLNKNLSAGLPLVEISEPQIQRVLFNLLANAKAAVREGGTVTVTTGLHQGSPLGGAAVAVVVEDTGPGFTPATEQNLFKPFHTTKGPGGTGLGLYLSREIVTRHAGLLQASNRPEGGARFAILLPAMVGNKRLVA